VHADENAAVGEGFGQVPDSSNDFGAPGGKGGEVGGGVGILRGGGAVADADDVGGLAGVTGVENAANLLVCPEKGVGFIDEQGGLNLLDNAEEGGGADVSGDDRAIDELAEDAKESGFAAAFFGGLQADVSADVSEVEDVGVEGPQGERFGAPLGQDDMAGDEPGQVLQEKAAGDGGFPGGDFRGSEDGRLFGFGWENVIGCNRHRSRIVDGVGQRLSMAWNIRRTIGWSIFDPNTGAVSIQPYATSERSAKIEERVVEPFPIGDTPPWEIESVVCEW